MNPDLLQNLSAGLEALMCTRHQLLASQTLKDNHLSEVAFPLTPALSPWESENRPPVDRKSDLVQHSSVPLAVSPKPEDQTSDIRNSASHPLLFPPPKGEGQGEGKVLAHFKSVPA